MFEEFLSLVKESGIKIDSFKGIRGNTLPGAKYENEEQHIIEFMINYHYTYALLHANQIENGIKSLEALQRIYNKGYHSFGYNGNLKLYLRFINLVKLNYTSDKKDLRDSIGYFTNDGWENAEINSIAYYYLALLDFEEKRYFDGLNRIRLAMSSFTGYYYEKASTLENTINDYLCSLDINNNLLETTKKARNIGESYRVKIDKIQLDNSGRYAAVIYKNGILKIWNTTDGTDLFSYEDDKDLFRNFYKSMCFSHDSKYLALGCMDGKVIVIDLSCMNVVVNENFCKDFTSDELESYAYFDEFTYISFSPKSNYLIVVPTADNFDPQAADGIVMDNLPGYKHHDKISWCFSVNNQQDFLQPHPPNPDSIRLESANMQVPCIPRRVIRIK